MEVTVKVENYNNCNDRSYTDVLVANVVKSEFVEFNHIDALLKNVNSKDNNLGMLNKILKTETKTIADEYYSSNPSDEADCTHNIIDVHIHDDSNSGPDPDPERDPFGDIDCDPGFSQKCSSTNFSAEDEIGDKAVVNHKCSAKTTFSPTKAALNNNAQFNILDSKLRCELCLETQSSVDELKVHLKNCASSHKARRRFCVPCNKLYTQSHSYKLHALKIHGIKIDQDYSSFNCEVYPKHSTYKESCLANSTLHQEMKSGTKDGLKQTSFKCLKCPSSFSEIRRLKSHIKKSHKHDFPFKCPSPSCERTFKLNSSVKRHFTQVHCMEKPFKCPVLNCEKTYNSNYILQRHRASHLQLVEKSCKCPHSDCDQVLKNKDCLRKHLASAKHDEVRPFKCEQCNLAFIRNDHLTKHLELHSKGKEQDWFKCPESNCYKTFKLHSSLQIHVLNFHTNKKSASFECPEPNCNKKFKAFKHVREHFRTHTLPYKCREPGCSAMFPERGRLISHIGSKHKSCQAK